MGTFLHSSCWLLGIKLAPAIRADRIRDYLAGRRRLELNTGQAHLAVFWAVLVIRSVVRNLCLRLCNSSSRSDRGQSSGDERRALQYQATRNAMMDRLCLMAHFIRPQNGERCSINVSAFATPEACRHNVQADMVAANLAHKQLVRRLPKMQSSPVIISTLALPLFFLSCYFLREYLTAHSSEACLVMIMQ